MGFGSGDESEQQRESVSADDEDAAVTVHENAYEGEISVETGSSTDDLLGRLQEIKERTEEQVALEPAYPFSLRRVG